MLIVSEKKNEGLHFKKIKFNKRIMNGPVAYSLNFITIPIPFKNKKYEYLKQTM